MSKLRADLVSHRVSGSTAEGHQEGDARARGVVGEVAQELAENQDQAGSPQVQKFRLESQPVKSFGHQRGGLALFDYVFSVRKPKTILELVNQLPPNDK